MKATAVKGLQAGKGYIMTLDELTAWHNVFETAGGEEIHSIRLQARWKHDLGRQTDFVRVPIADDGSIEFGPNSQLSRMLCAMTGLEHQVLEEAGIELLLGTKRGKKGVDYGDPVYDEDFKDDDDEMKPGWHLLPIPGSEETKEEGFHRVPCDIRIEGKSILGFSAYLTLKTQKDSQYLAVKTYAPDPNAEDLPF